MYIKVEQQGHWKYYCVADTDHLGNAWGWAFEMANGEIHVYPNTQVIVKKYVEISESQFYKAFNQLRAKLNSIR